MRWSPRSPARSWRRGCRRRAPCRRACAGRCSARGCCVLRSWGLSCLGGFGGLTTSGGRTPPPPHLFPTDPRTAENRRRAAGCPSHRRARPCAMRPLCVWGAGVLLALALAMPSRNAAGQQASEQRVFDLHVHGGSWPPEAEDVVVLPGGEIVVLARGRPALIRVDLRGEAHVLPVPRSVRRACSPQDSRCCR